MTVPNMQKAVILARGLGTRMRKTDANAQTTDQQAAIAQTGIKALIPIDRPFLDYVLHALAEAGYQKICLVIGPEHHDVRDYYTRQLSPRRISIEFAVQQEPLGTADAVAAAEEFADGDHILVINSDNYYPQNALQALRQISTSGLAVFERDSMIRHGNIPRERLTKFAVVKISPTGNLIRILEKPDEQTIASLAEPVCLSMNCWRFGPAIFDACRSIKPSKRGELELSDAVQYAIDQLNEPFRVLTFNAAVLDLSCRDDIKAVTEKLAGSEVNL